MGLLTNRIDNKLAKSNLINEHALIREPVPSTQAEEQETGNHLLQFYDPSLLFLLVGVGEIPEAGHEKGSRHISSHWWGKTPTMTWISEQKINLARTQIIYGQCKTEYDLGMRLKIIVQKVVCIFNPLFILITTLYLREVETLCTSHCRSRSVSSLIPSPSPSPPPQRRVV